MTYLDYKGYISNIQSFSVNDGEGIRTNIFLTGCPLRCRWCSNPETWRVQPRLAVYREKCTGCDECARVCPNNGEGCIACGICVNSCPVDARKIMGSIMSVKEVLARVKRDLIFFRESGGGVTFSGGEPTFQRDFLYELVNGHESIGVDMAIETSGYFVWKEVEDILKKIDLIFIDIKHMDADKHYALTGVRNEVILENIRKLGRLGKEVVVRIPLVKGSNSDTENITKTAEFVKQYVPSGKIELLPYHNLGGYKYDLLGISEYKTIFETPTKEDIGLLKEVIRSLDVEQADYR